MWFPGKVPDLKGSDAEIWMPYAHTRRVTSMCCKVGDGDHVRFEIWIRPETKHEYIWLDFHGDMRILSWLLQ